MSVFKDRETLKHISKQILPGSKNAVISVSGETRVISSGAISPESRFRSILIGIPLAIPLACFFPILRFRFLLRISTIVETLR